jgi:hypothetical protein
LVCDIDGVLIPFPAADGAIPDTHLEHWARFTGKPDPVRVWLNPGHGPQLADLVERTGAEPSWCSTWRQDSAPQIGARLGLPTWPSIVLPTPPTDSSHQAGHLWKQPHVAEQAGENPLIWIDDDFTDLDHTWAAERTAAGLPTLLVEPDPYVGIQPEHFELITAFVAALDGTRHPDSSNSGQAA